MTACEIKQRANTSALTVFALRSIGRTIEGGSKAVTNGADRAKQSPIALVIPNVRAPPALFSIRGGPMSGRDGEKTVFVPQAIRLSGK